MTLYQELVILINKFGTPWSPQRHTGCNYALIVVVCCRRHRFILNIKNETYTNPIDSDTRLLGNQNICYKEEIIMKTWVSPFEFLQEEKDRRYFITSHTTCKFHFQFTVGQQTFKRKMKKQITSALSKKTLNSVNYLILCLICFKFVCRFIIKCICIIYMY